MRDARRALLIFAFTLVPSLAQATSSGRSELSVGVANPSLTDAVAGNPAGLSDGGGRGLEVGVNPTSLSNLDAYGVFASGKGSFGFGLLIMRSYMGSLNATLGAGVKVGRFSLGINATSSIMNFTPHFGAGFITELGRGRLGLFAADLTNPTRAWTLGLAFGGSSLHFGLDAAFTALVGNIAPSGAMLIPTVEFVMAKKLAIKLCYGVTVMPTFYATPGVGLGAQYWIGSSWAIFGRYNTGYYPMTLGVNVAL